MTSAADALRFATASRDDLADVEELVRSAYAKYIERIGREPAPMHDDYATRIALGRVSVVRRGSALLGVIVTEPLQDHLHVTTIAVAPDAQGEGIGTALLDRAEGEARALGLPEIRLYTNASMHENLAFYPRRGYVEVDRRIEDGFDRVYFARRL